MSNNDSPRAHPNPPRFADANAKANANADEDGNSPKASPSAATNAHVHNGTVTTEISAESRNGEHRESLISVVIPAYNYAHFLPAALESVFAQTYAPLEIIVVDDGSRDRTPEVLANYGDRLVTIRQENQGLSAARNRGIAQARGRYVALLDTDDLWHPRKLEYQIRYLTRHPEIGLLGSLADSDPEPRHFSEELDVEAVAVPLSLRQVTLRTFFTPSSVVIRRDLFREIGGFDTSLRSAEDRDMWIRIADRFPIAMLDAPLTWYRIHDGNMSRAALLMEHSENDVLDRAFQHVAGLRPQWILRRKAKSLARYSAAFRYDDLKNYRTALLRIAQSFLMWPWPLSAGEINRPWGRCKLGCRILKHWWKSPESFL